MYLSIQFIEYFYIFCYNKTTTNLRKYENKYIQLEQCPENIKDLLTQELNRHNHDKTGNYKIENQIKKDMSDSLGYILKMYWLGRGDKMSSEIKPALEWLSRNLLDENLASKFTGFKNHESQLEGENHEKLSYEVVDRLFNLMKSAPGINLPVPVEKFSIKKLFKMK